MINRYLSRLAATLPIVFSVTVSACATTNSNLASSAPQASATPIPYVENCAVVRIGSPSSFACNGKVYTAFELAKIREEQTAKNLASSK